MRILFFCACLEAGRDGVGDYTRLLASECTRLGHACTLIALNDHFVAQTTDTTVGGVRRLRLPAAQSWSDRFTRATDELRAVGPDWVSWQLVTYGFHPRGLVPAALLASARSLRGLRSHVMLHELWIGLEAGAPWKARATGWFQRRGLLRLLRKLQPDVRQTSNPAYQAALAANGFVAGGLGLFGNVAISTETLAREHVLSPWQIGAASGVGSAPLVGLTFGTLHRQWQPEATLAWWLATAERLDRDPLLLAIGRVGSHAPALLDLFRRGGVPVAETGEQDESSVSNLLRSADFGLAVHPWALVGKSGAAAAMLDHGLPVLVPRDDWHLRGSPDAASAEPNPLLTRLTGLDPTRTDRWLALKRAPHASLPQIAQSFLEGLAAAQGNPAIPK